MQLVLGLGGGSSFGVLRTWLPLGLATGVVIQALLAAAVIRRIVDSPLLLISGRDIAGFVLVCIVTGLAGGFLVAAATAASSPVATGPGLDECLWCAFGQAVGMLIVAPAVLSWSAEPQADWRPRRLPLGLTVGVLTFASAWAYVHTIRLDHERTRNRFELEAQGLASHLAAELQALEHALLAVHSALAAGHPTDRRSFAQLTKPWLDQSTLLHALGFSERLDHADIAGFESRALAEGYGEQRVVSATGSGQVRPVKPGEVIVAIRHIEPFDRNRLVVGVNSYANAVAGRAIDASIRSGETAATQAFPLRLPPDFGDPDPRGVLLYRALYAGAPVGDAERQHAAYGVVFATLRMGGVLASVAAASPPGYELCLVEFDDHGAAQRIAGRLDCNAPGDALAYRRPLKFSDRAWEFRAMLPAALAQHKETPAFATLVAFFCFSAVAALGAMLLALTGRTRRIELAMAEAERAWAAAVTANQAKSEFISRMSHELRTPLNAVIGFAQVMQSEAAGSLSHRHSRWVRLIYEAGLHLNAMIDDVLDLSRIEHDRFDLRLETLRLKPLLEQSLAMVERGALQRGITVELSPDAQSLTVQGDATRVRQVLSNLLSNAIKYNVERGRVDVQCRSAADMVEIEVRDTGLGMSASQVTQLFQPFNRLGRERSDIPGTGIGLVISRRLAEAMGGCLAVRSEAGKGSSFVLALPRGTGSEVLPSQDRPAAAEGERGHVQQIACIEDNPINAELIRAVLSKRPHTEVHVWPDGRQALAAVWSQPPDAILLDLHLPDMSGLDVLRRLKGDPRSEAIPVLVVSADVMTAKIDAVIQAGARAFIGKPVQTALLLAALDEALMAAPVRH